MKTLRRRLLIAALLLPLCPLAATAATTTGAAEDGNFQAAPGVRSIAITATDRVVHTAEIGTVTVGFQIFAPDKDAAYAQGSATSNAIVAALALAGVPKSAIHSESQTIEANPYFDAKMTPAERAARQFRLAQSWTVRVRADDAARALDVAVKAGANASGNIDWTLADPNAAEAEAAGKALQRARAQAAAMAGGLNVKLGNLLYASNQVNAAPVRPLPMEMRAFALAAKPAPAPLAINPREIETSATVYAVFAIE